VRLLTRTDESSTRLGVAAFDDERAVANARALLPALLAGRLGIERLAEQTGSLGDRLGGANAGRKVVTTGSAMALGARTPLPPARISRCRR
jgi:hypothetical protein